MSRVLAALLRGGEMSETWKVRVWREFRAENLTRSWRDVLLTLQTFRGRLGMICPSHF